MFEGVADVAVGDLKDRLLDASNDVSPIVRAKAANELLEFGEERFDGVEVR